MKLEEVRSGYTHTAHQYDKILDFWFGKVLRIEKYRQEAIGLLGLKKGDVVLDIGCGTGVNFHYLEEMVGEKGRIIGVDYTEAMLHEARKKIEKNRWKNITLKQGDAVHIDEIVHGCRPNGAQLGNYSEREKADAVVSTYCFGILYDARQAFENALKLLKKGGSITILDFATVKPRSRFVRSFFRLYSCYVRKYKISSDEDLDEDGFQRSKRQWMDIAQKNLTGITQKDFLFGMGLIYSGRKKNG